MKKKSQHQASPQEFTYKHDTPREPGATKLWRIIGAISHLQVVTVVADSEAEAWELICRANSGDKQAAERVTCREPIPHTTTCYPSRCADLATEPDLVAKLQHQRVRITDAIFRLDFEGGDA